MSSESITTAYSESVAEAARVLREVCDVALRAEKHTSACLLSNEARAFAHAVLGMEAKAVATLDGPTDTEP
jgi:hypothetical protein